MLLSENLRAPGCNRGVFIVAERVFAKSCSLRDEIFVISEGVWYGEERLGWVKIKNKTQHNKSHCGKKDTTEGVKKAKPRIDT